MSDSSVLLPKTAGRKAIETLIRVNHRQTGKTFTLTNWVIPLALSGTALLQPAGAGRERRCRPTRYRSRHPVRQQRPVTQNNRIQTPAANKVAGIGKRRDPQTGLHSPTMSLSAEIGRIFSEGLARRRRTGDFERRNCGCSPAW